jgi:hypothetical protein
MNGCHCVVCVVACQLCVVHELLHGHQVHDLQPAHKQPAQCMSAACMLDQPAPAAAVELRGCACCHARCTPGRVCPCPGASITLWHSVISNHIHPSSTVTLYMSSSSLVLMELMLSLGCTPAHRQHGSQQQQSAAGRQHSCVLLTQFEWSGPARCTAAGDPPPQVAASGLTRP